MINRAFRCRMLAALACSALAALGMSSCGSVHSANAAFSSSAAIWFHPKPAELDWPMASPVGGSTDFLSLFQDGAPWPRALAQTQAIGLYAGWIVDIGPQVLGSVVAFLNAHNLAIEVEAPAMQALATCGSGVEGYVPYGQTVHDFTLAYLLLLKQAGAQKIFIKVDEPYFFGNVVNDPRSCHFSPQQIATEVGQYVQLVKTVYPDAEVGDVEPIVDGGYAPDVVTALGAWHATYQKITGAPFPFFFADLDFSNPAWPSLAKDMENQAHQSGMKFGIIYIGDMNDTSDAQWSAKAVARFEAYQGANGGNPDYVLFQSWEPYPQLCLPETDATTFTGVLDAYIDATLAGPA
jgi:hypothetical protein